MKLDKVYEIRDTTDELEGYQCLGIFDDLDSAIETVRYSEDPVSTDIYGEETISIYERQLNKFLEPKLVFQIVRREMYNEDKDEYFWKIV